MKEKEYKKISIDNLLALVHILDDYEEFNKKLKKFVSKKYNRDDIYNLYYVSKGKKCLSSNPRKFYKENKDIIDTINKYSDIINFISYIYDYSGRYAPWCDIEAFYKYLNDNKDKLDRIVNLLKKIQNLGFSNIKFTEEEDFKDKEYNIYLNSLGSISSSILNSVNYLENMELIPDYRTDIIRYKTNGSNYRMEFPNRDDVRNWAGKEIILNNLLFDVDCLPKSLKKEDTVNKILALKEIKKEEEESIKDLVNLGVGIFDFEKGYANLKYKVDGLECVKSKDELKQILSNIKLELEKIKKLNNNEILENEFVTDTQIENEKKRYLKSREFQYLDLD